MNEVFADIGKLLRNTLAMDPIPVEPGDVTSFKAQRHGLRFELEPMPPPEAPTWMQAAWRAALLGRVTAVRRNLCNTKKAILDNGTSIHVGQADGRVAVEVTCWLLPIKPEVLVCYKEKKDVLFVMPASINKIK